MSYKPPSRILFRILRIIALPIFKLVFSYKRTVDPDVLTTKGPTMIVGNHTNYLDPVFVALALPHRTINFVAGSVLMKRKMVRRFMSLFQVIPKLQFVTDTRALRSMLEIIKQDGSLALFPEARRSLDGASEPFDIATAKLIKKYKMNVITVRTYGAYLAWPRWSKAIFAPGPVESSSTLLLRPEDVERYTAEEINNIIMRALNGNDFDWQEKRKKKALYRTSKPALGLDQMLHRCPECQTDLVISSSNKKLRCSNCKYQVEVKRDRLFHQVLGHKLYFPSPYDWHQWERKLSQEARFIEQSSWSMKASIEALDYGEDPTSKLSMLISDGIKVPGTLLVSSMQFEFIPDDKSLDANVLFKLQTTVQQVFTSFKYIQLSTNGKIYNIWPEEPQNCIRLLDWAECEKEADS